ncbi:MAG: Holliday junction branch migration protein RuvA [Paludibacteraceae bacterium]|nr:Holliday junction branch migration protein RuvA [Paludibacteraceae bacterium]MBQ1851684.1 Holliday junction branch migration protein RuvA [Paludibacteraceae bacterium]MBQ2065837.1 Holliday junction branch migration protein RuvA [Paludibacteraceae bacterium]MBQ4032746.1 Holliday junction branch migration protein RuvA [Paludibacteraceae bacterium]MBQ5524459.1 Holliday junction branch migration protein RuvA [Paludibacteraceae bacterium]
MIEYISGTLTELNPTMAVVETAGVGFAVNISLGTYSALNGRQSVKLYVYEAIREDAYTLYGFATKEERQMFMLLVSVSGVGAGTARMILSSVSTAELRDAVLTGNERILKGVKGIGLKTAQRIIVDLKDKVGAVSVSGQDIKSQTAAASVDADEAIQALQMLGFAVPQVRKAVQKITEENPAASVEQIIKQALKMM